MPQLNQAAKRDLARRGLISDTVLSLIGRAKGLDLLHHNEGLDVDMVTVSANDESSEAISRYVQEGYAFAGLTPEIPARIVLERLDGLFYPVTSYRG